MPASHAKTPLLVVANARHGSTHGSALRLDQWRFAAPFRHEQKTLSLRAPGWRALRAGPAVAAR
ncbi:MAG TPA: hypothetical protein PLH47_06060, partial [Ottowia sp.]|nr:hypothetical protein [Ottowia sp.]